MYFFVTFKIILRKLTLLAIYFKIMPEKNRKENQKYIIIVKYVYLAKLGA